MEVNPDDAPIVVLIAAVALVLCAIIGGGWYHDLQQDKLDAAAPVITTCIQHPATRSKVTAE